MSHTKEPIKPSDLKEWEKVKDKKVYNHCVGNHPERYGWYLDNGTWFPHRLPTLTEMELNKFN